MKNLTPTWSTRKTLSPFDDFDRLVDGFFKPSREMKFNPQCDIEEYAKFFKLTFDVPGLKPEDIQIEVQGNQLTVSGERKFETSTEEKGWSRFERNFGTFQRSFTLPDVAAFDAIEAHHDHGVLEITIPKTESTHAKKVEIKSKSGFAKSNQADNEEKH